MELRERDTVLGRIAPDAPAQYPEEWPDFAARAGDALGDRIFHAVDDLIEDREPSILTV